MDGWLVIPLMGLGIPLVIGLFVWIDQKEERRRKIPPPDSLNKRCSACGGVYDVTGYLQGQYNFQSFVTRSGKRLLMVGARCSVCGHVDFFTPK